MDECINALTSFPPNQDLLKTDKHYNEVLSAHVKSLDGVIHKYQSLISSNPEKILSNLQAGVHTASYVAVLAAALKTESKPLGPRHVLLNQILDCLVFFDQRQVRYVGGWFRSILEYILLNKVYSPIIAVDAVATALLRLDPSGSVLTTTHCLFANMVYTTGCIEQARPVLEKTIIFYPEPTSQAKRLCDESLPPTSYITKSTGLTGDLTSSHVLEYDMVRALVFIQERRWAPALDALERCVAFPTDDATVSTIMLQAFYKWTLVSLILHGRIIGLPGAPSAATSHAYESKGELYIRFDTLFAEEDAAAFLEYRRQNNATFANDGNLGLVDEVLASFQKRQIIRLGDLYSKISIPEIRQLSQSAVTGKNLDTDEEVVHLVREMIDTGVLRGHLHSPGGDQPDYLEFLSASEALTEAEFAKQVLAAKADIEALDAVVKTTNAGLTRNKDYVRFLQREKKRKERDPEGRDLGVDFDAQIEDEDLMLGVGGPES